MRRNPLLWAIPLQAILLFWNLDLLDPWGDEWFTLTTVPQPLSQVASTVAGNIHPPLYYFSLHYWIQLPLPGSLIAKMRAMSALWTVIATVFVYTLWLRREESKFQRMFLASWALSPGLLLHGRMARSYSMQLAIAPVAIYSGLQWAEQPRNWRRFLACAASIATLLYTHYLSGLAVTAALCLLLLFKKRFAAGGALVAMLMLLYLPWLPALLGALGRWKSAGMPPEANVTIDQIIRLAYVFVSFSFGETLSTLSLLLGVALAPVLVYALWRSARSRPVWLPLLLIATAIAWIGITRWAQFPFMPTGLIFTLPFFLILLVRKMNSVTFAALLLLYASADYAYFTRSGFLIKPYATPYREMAVVIRSDSQGRDAILAVDSYGSFYEPLLEKLGKNVHVIVLDDPTAAEAVRTAAGVPAVSGRPGTSLIWLWRHTRDVSPGGFITKLESDLSAGHEVRRYDFLPYSPAERWVRRVLGGPGQPKFYYRLSEVR
jgi:hypothetical protein